MTFHCCLDIDVSFLRAASSIYQRNASTCTSLITWFRPGKRAARQAAPSTGLSAATTYY
jgi:hypothetical protein